MSGNAPQDIYFYGGYYTSDFDGFTLNTADNTNLFCYGLTLICDAQDISSSNPNHVARALYSAGVTGGTMELYGCTIKAGSSSGAGDDDTRSNAIYNAISEITAYGCNFSNTATDPGGSGSYNVSCIENTTSGTLNLVGCRISNAEGEDITNTGTVTITGTDFDSSNTSGSL